MAFDIDQALTYMVEREGSDLHVKVDSPPVARVHGDLWALQGMDDLTAQETEKALHQIADESHLTEFEATGEVDFSYEIPDVSRFRVAAYKQRGAVSIALRAIPYAVRTIDELGLPQVVKRLADEPRGIILLTGTTGSGKSTTLAAMIDQINSTKARHVVTLEDPIEYLHHDKMSIINQREVGSDTTSFGQAMRRVLRQDPDVILIGEMRDEETVRTALSAAETGHLVLSTLHTLDATETINRIIDFFPPHLQQQARVMLSATLKGAISQRLVPRSDREGRIAVSEVMVATGRVQDLIINPEETGRISEVIAEGDYYGMQTFDQALLGYVTEGQISEEVAMQTASSPHDFKLMLAADGQRASGIEQLMENGDGAEPSRASSA
ncbi:MAG TPA: type IV pilus twitching motility protein PilT [Solirubrobacterales bacterium]|jgi:twitching motility protein PilT|nr:type IV pilus twitching motility protein PilT [Solirubrobacterales bacterium]